MGPMFCIIFQVGTITKFDPEYGKWKDSVGKGERLFLSQ
jgi:hypothetical protein